MCRVRRVGTVTRYGTHCSDHLLNCAQHPLFLSLGVFDPDKWEGKRSLRDAVSKFILPNLFVLM